MPSWTDTFFIAGHPALDFLNTAGGATKDRTPEHLTTFGVAAEWARTARLLDATELHAARADARTDPATAQAALERLRVQREALHTFLLAETDGAACADSVSDRVKADIIAAHRAARLRPDPHAESPWQVRHADAGPYLLAHRIALATAALLASDQRLRIAACGRCSWLFLDHSPTRRRRWCSMATCGNRAKAQRHHRR